jgi:transcriptional regulator with XRE-family HTH domain
VKADARKVLKAFGQRVRELRLQTQLTQEQLAERLSWHPRRVQRVEAGEANASIESLVELSVALGVNVSSLLVAPGSIERRRPGRPPRTQ